MKRIELIEYFKSERNRFEKTRDIQWKFNIALWTLLALGISFLKSEMIACKCLLWAAIVLFLFAHFLFAYLIQKGLIGSRNLANSILDGLDKPITNEKEKGEEIGFPIRRINKIEWTWADRWWIVFQLLASVVLIIVLLIKLKATSV